MHILRLLAIVPSLHQLLGVFEAHEDNSDLICLAAQTLAGLASCDEAVQRIVENDGVGIILATAEKLALDPENGAAIAESMFQLLDRLAQRGDLVALIKAAGGVKSVVNLMEMFPDNAIVLAAGSKVLDREFSFCVWSLAHVRP